MKADKSLTREFFRCMVLPEAGRYKCRCMIDTREASDAVLYVSGKGKHRSAWIFQNVVEGARPKQFDKLNRGYLFSWRIGTRMLPEEMESFLAYERVTGFKLQVPVCPDAPEKGSRG